MIIKDIPGQLTLQGQLSNATVKSERQRSIQLLF